MAAMLLIVAVLSAWELQQPLSQLASGVAHWLAFTWADHPDLNGVALTGLITAGATWTLRYEWAFYLTLPLLALLLAARPPLGYLAMAIAAGIAVQLMHLSAMVMASFAGGIVAAVLVRKPSVRAIATRTLSTWVVIACVTAVFVLFPTPYSLRAMLLLTIAFVLVAAGNTLFGILTLATSRMLGELTYSIYILHGIVLFAVFRFGLGFSAAARFSALGHWGIIALSTPLLISLCFFTFQKIELRGMRSAPKVMGWIASLQGKAEPHHTDRIG
jgi:peptidoglycan/LPS O-acetylase OafA/YrhL